MRTLRGGGTILLGLMALLLIPRLIGLNLFATIDEPYWLTSGSNFYYALGQRDFANTVYDYHPAVTTMWIVALALLVYFPQYRGLGQGYFDVYKDSLDQFLLEHGRSPLGLLVAARVLQVLLITVLLVLIFLLLRRLFDERFALVAVLLISFDPFFLGHSRLITHEGIMTMFVLISVLAVCVHLFHSRNWYLLLLSGTAAGLAQLTKSSAVVLIPVVGLLFLIAAVRPALSMSTPRPKSLLLDLAVWFGTLALVYVVLWPGMWVAPGRMLTEVFGNAFSYAVAGARLSAVAAEPSVEFQPRLGEIDHFIQTILWRTTPLTWIGAAVGLLALIRTEARRRLVLLSVVLLGSLFILLFGVASGRNSAHYVLMSYAAINMLAAAGILAAVDRVAQRSSPALARWLPAALCSAAILLQAASALPFFPYYYNYYSPVMEGLDSGRQNPNFGYGEGLDLAARYLDAKPGSADSTAMAFYGRGPFSFFYRGDTEPLKTVYADAENVPQLQETLRETDYLVIYYALQHGRNVPANLMTALEGTTAEATIWYNSIEYARIYAVQDFAEAFYTRLWP